MQRFIGRKKELNVLNEEYGQCGNSFFPVYGRRRVGKSELIKHFIKNKESLYYLGKQAPPLMQIKEFLTIAAKSLNQPLLASLSLSSWQEALSVVVSQLNTEQKFVFAIDEFQWLVQSSPELPSILQEYIDNDWNSKKVFLILCGSYMGFMEKKVFGEKSPLFGRRTGQMLLKPFTYLEAKEFHSNWSYVDQAKAYFICGGIPYYLNFFESDLSIDQNIQVNFLNEYSALAKEPIFLLREELKELQNYYAILTALSSGSSTNKAISIETGIDERKLYYYIQNLVELGYVCRHYPLTSSRPTPATVHFKLQDPLLRFWFRFIFKNESMVSQLDSKTAFMNVIKPHLQAYFGECFESLCRQALPLFYLKNGVTSSFKVGEYWSKKVQIDIIGNRDDGRIDIGECKWGKINSTKQLEASLQEKIKHYPNPNNKTISPCIFSNLNLKLPKNSLCQLYTLKDIYSLDS